MTQLGVPLNLDLWAPLVPLGSNANGPAVSGMADETPQEAASAGARLKISAKLLLSIPGKDLTQGNTLLDFPQQKKMYLPKQATKYGVAMCIQHYPQKDKTYKFHF